MPRFDSARAAAPLLALVLALAGTPAWSARSVQGEVLFDGVPAISEQIAAGLQRYGGGSETRLLDWSSDGTLLVAAHQHGRDQLLRLQASAGAPVRAAPLSLGGTSGSALRSLQAQPFHSALVAYLQDTVGADGRRGAALYLSTLDGGAAQLLVNAAARPGTPAWAHDGRQLAFSAALRDGQNPDLYVIDTASPAGPRLVATGGASGWQVLAWSSTDRALLVHHSVAAAADELLLVDIDSGALRRVDAPGERSPGYGHIGEARFAADGRGVYFVSDRDSDVAQLRYADLYGESSQIVGPKLGHDIEHFDVSANGRSLAYTWNENGYSRVALLDRRTNLASTIADLPPGIIAALRFDRSGARLAIELAASAAPRDVYVYELPSARSARWSASQLGELQPAQLVSPQTLRFPTWDRPDGHARTLTAQVYRPRASAPHAVLVLLDDPDAQLGTQLDPFVQYCVNELRLAVIAPDLRSGEAGALDLGALLAWLGAQPDLRRDRVAILGRGAGGTLALAGLGLYSDRLRAGISIDGNATSAQIAAVRQPVLLVRGLRTPVLDAGSAEQLLWRLRSVKAESWLVAPRETQGQLTSEAAQTAAQQVIAQFLAGNLGG